MDRFVCGAQSANSARTVKRHLEDVYKRLNIKGRNNLAEIYRAAEIAALPGGRELVSTLPDVGEVALGGAYAELSRSEDLRLGIA